MEARQLMEGIRTEDKSYVQQLVQKWNPLLEGIKGEHVRKNTAVLLENQTTYLQSLTEETTSQNVGSFLKFVFPVLRRVWPRLSWAHC